MELLADNYTVLTPVYGRDFKSAKLITAAFMAGFDFDLAITGQKISVKQIKPGTKINLRYNQMRSVCIVTAPANAQDILPPPPFHKWLETVAPQKKSR